MFLEPARGIGDVDAERRFYRAAARRIGRGQRGRRRGPDAGLRPLGHGGRGHQQRERERRAVYMSKHGKAVLIVRVIIVRGTVSIAKVRARGFGAQWRSVSIPSAASKSWSNGRRRAA